MRTKALLLGALIGAASLATSMAQVYSVNIVGYINLPVPAGFSIACNQLNNPGGNAVDVVLGNPPCDITLYKWNTSIADWVIVDYYQQFQFWNDTSILLNPGEGFWIENKGTNFTITLVGEVQTGSSTIILTNGLNLVGPVVPQEGLLQTDLAYVPSAGSSGGDTVYTYRSDAISWGIFDYYSQYSVWNEEPTIHVGEGFWVFKQTPGNWSRTFNVGP